MNEMVTEYKIQQLEKEVQELKAWKTEQIKKENGRLYSGLIFLGSMVLSLGAYIWHKVGGG